MLKNYYFPWLILEGSSLDTELSLLESDLSYRGIFSCEFGFYQAFNVNI